jgi:hypothetical protein
MFDFVSPFDALTPTSAAPGRKPAPVSHQQGSSEQFEDTWSSVIDPKRKSVDNFLEQLSIPKAPAPPSAHPYDRRSPQQRTPTPDKEIPIAELVQSKAMSRPLPPKPTQAPSPRPSPPKISARRDVQAPEHPLGPQVGPPLSHMPTAQAQRDKESSPGPRGSWKGHEGGRNRGSGSKAKAQTGPM